MSLALRRRLMLGLSHVSASPLSRIDIAEVSMLCVDGSDGKSGYIDLTAISSDGGPMGALTWISSNNALATVTPISLTKARVTAVSGAALGSAVTISCTQGAIVKTCSVAVFSTMPTSRSQCAAIKGGKGPGTNSNSVYIVFQSSSVPSSFTLTCFRLGVDFLVPSAEGVFSQFCVLKSSSRIHNFPIEYQQASDKRRPSVSSFSGSSRTDLFYGSSMSAGSNQSMDFIKASDGVFINDAAVSTSATNTGTFTQSDAFGVIFRQNTKKADFLVFCQDQNKATIKGNAKDQPFFCCFQNYIRYTDHDSYVNYTVIPNIGTLGRNYDLTANNVPSLWYGV